MLSYSKPMQMTKENDLKPRLKLRIRYSHVVLHAKLIAYLLFWDSCYNQFRNYPIQYLGPIKLQYFAGS